MWIETRSSPDFPLVKRQEVAVTRRTDDYDAIVRVMQLYIDGFNDNDIGKFREAFHEDAWIFFVDADGVLHKSLISEYFEEWAAPPDWGVVGRFISVTQVGDVASVQVSFDRTSDKSSGWIDFHNLVRINGVWKITNKTATHSSR
jgi:ketosteroid isomerase-like protein